ncbi:hypothetical protein AB0876_28935 [Mycobacterium sp. NPDC049093]
MPDEQAATNDQSVPNLQQLITEQKNLRNRSYGDYERMAGYVISRQRWQQLGTGARIKEFSEPATIKAMAEALEVDVAVVVLAMAKSLGLPIESGVAQSDLAVMLPPSARKLTPEQRDAVVRLVRVFTPEEDEHYADQPDITSDSSTPAGASGKANEGKEAGAVAGGSRLDIAFGASTEKLFSDAEEQVMADSTRTLRELFRLLGTIDPSFDLAAELDTLHRELGPIRDTPTGMVGILKGEAELLRRARDSMLAYVDAAEMNNTIAEVEATTIRNMLAQVEGHLRAYPPAYVGNVVRPVIWGQSPPPPTFDEADAASQGYKQSDDEDQ